VNPLIDNKISDVMKVVGIYSNSNIHIDIKIYY